MATPDDRVKELLSEYDDPAACMANLGCEREVTNVLGLPLLNRGPSPAG